MNDDSNPIMSIHGGTGPRQAEPLIPRPPAAEQETLFRTIRVWLDNCSKGHRSCRVDPLRTSCSADVVGSPPLRFIRVGGNKEDDKKSLLGEDDKIYLIETRRLNGMKWTALSHQWGDGPQFRTTISNQEAHMKGLKVGQLPATFRDAVAVTRAIGCQYLWIDSLCIIQGDGGDFKEQAKRMEQIYSGAHCVLAASRSPGHDAGFLGPRTEIDTIALQTEGTSGTFYVSKTIDDFNGHVLDRGLNRRGWVLQEHALARRTIYFTDNQAYFECGDGVSCESLMKMRNAAASFLGDSNFPESIMKRADRSERILHFQKLYQEYSRLLLKHSTDRPVAIAGLQGRILKAMNARGDFGVFDEEKAEKGGHSRGRGLLRRSLLWCRGTDVTALEPINFFPEQTSRKMSSAKVPSWSWMAYDGGIDYLVPSFGRVDWWAVNSPWFPEFKKNSTILVAEASEYHSTGCHGRECKIEFDQPAGRLKEEAGECVILGTERPEGVTQSSRATKHFVLAIEYDNFNGVYRRVGAGYMFGNCLRSQKVKVEIH